MMVSQVLAIAFPWIHTVSQVLTITFPWIQLMVSYCRCQLCHSFFRDQLLVQGALVIPWLYHNRYCKSVRPSLVYEVMYVSQLFVFGLYLKCQRLYLLTDVHASYIIRPFHSVQTSKTRLRQNSLEQNRPLYFAIFLAFFQQIVLLCFSTMTEFG